jgi:hypothetical protein
MQLFLKPYQVTAVAPELERGLGAAQTLVGSVLEAVQLVLNLFEL